MVNTEHPAGTCASPMASLNNLVKQQKLYVLAINAGSPSIKFALYQTGARRSDSCMAKSTISVRVAPR